MSDKNGIAQVEKPIQLAWRNRRVRMKETTKGEIFYLLELELDEESWAFLKTMPRNAEGEMVIWMTEIGMVEEAAPKKEKGPKGAYSYFWEYLHPNGGKGGSGFVTLPGVREAIEEQRLTETEPTWELLHRVFGVGGGTLAEIGPGTVKEKFPDNQRVELFIDRAMKFQNEKEAR